MTRALLISETAPGSAGGSQRYHLQIARGLAALGVEVHAIYGSAFRPPEAALLECTASQTGPFHDDSGLLLRRARQIRALLSGRCSLLGGTSNESMQRAVMKALDGCQPDLILVSHLRVGYFVNLIRELHPKARIVFISHNCETDVRELYLRRGRFMDRIFAQIDLPRVRDYERSVTQAADAVTAISARDARLFERLFGIRPAGILPPFLSDVREVDWSARLQAMRAPRLLHCGTFQYRAKAINLEWFLDQVFPQLLQSVTGAETVIVGPGASRRMCRAARKRSGISVLGWVDNLDTEYDRCGVFVLPTLVGGGFELKTLEAAGRGCAMVGTSIPLEAAGFRHEEHCLMADSASQLADCLARVLSDSGLALRLAQAANEFVRSTYGWDCFCRQLQSVVSPACV